MGKAPVGDLGGRAGPGDLAQRLFDRLLGHFGPQNWWPAETRWEMMVGAILTQNTAWVNVEVAIDKLRKADVLTVEAMASIPLKDLAALVRSSGYFNQKASRLRGLARYIMTEHGGDLDHLFEQEGNDLRAELLSLRGIGPETADAIMLYAGEHLTFVIDAYTLRFATRYPLPFEAKYEPAREYFQANLQPDLYIYQEFHALLDELAKTYCRPRPECDGCVLHATCERRGVADG